jgi:UDP:flavonoid glycosyltransferase YjiC (YdhE family)
MRARSGSLGRVRVLITTTGFPGHVLPLVPFARACADAGHEVRVAAPRSRGALVRRLGLELAACDDPPAEEVGEVMATAAALSPEAGHAWIVAHGFAGVARRAQLPAVMRIAEGWRPDVVLRESHEFAGCDAAEELRIPHARVALGLAASDDAAQALAGAPPSPTLTLVPPVLERLDAPPACRLRAPASAPAGETEPLVYVTFGSVAASMGFFPRLYRAVADALAHLPVRVLMTTGGDTDLGPLPDNVRVETWVDQKRVLTRAAAVVCHGGYGTMLGALAHGLPLAVLPLFAGDQWDNARRIAEIGAGVALDRDTGRTMFDLPSASAITGLAGAVERVLGDDGHRRAAEEVAASAAALPPVAAAVDALEELTSGSRAAPPPGRR